MALQTKPSDPGYVAPHMRGLANGQSNTPAATSGVEHRSQTSASNAYEGVRTAEMRSVTDWSAGDSRRRKGGPTISYNAYDPQGVRHLRHRAPSSHSSEASTPVTPALQSVAGIAPPRAAAPPVNPDSAVRPGMAPQTTPSSSSTSVAVTNPTTGWAKAVSSICNSPCNSPSFIPWREGKYVKYTNNH